MTRRTKILATLGPSTDSLEQIQALIAAGANTVRMNFSHGQAEDHIERAKRVREAAKNLGKYVAILGDLQGPKIRVARFAEGAVRLEVGAKFILDAELGRDEGDVNQVGIDYKALPDDVSAGDILLLDDGRIQLRVTDVEGRKVITEVTVGGKLSNNKGINRQGGGLSADALTDKDKEDIKTAAEIGVDYLAVSFPRSGADLNYARELAEAAGCYAKICAKVERAETVASDEAMDDIISASDAVMVARGDLGVEIPAEEVPLIQKELVLRAKRARIPVIIATQMMETMISSLTPTRAEVNDVANSVMDGADAVMLSGETSVGKYPVQVIEKMASICRNVEDSELIQVPQDPPHIRTKRYITKAICYHAAHMANEISAKAICTLTNSGYTAFQISAWRPDAHILVYTSNHRILSRLNLLWGVKSFYYDKFVSTDETVEDVNRIAHERGFVEKGDYMINLAAMPIVDKGMVNTLRVSQV